MTYYQFQSTDGEEYGSFEVFYADAATCADLGRGDAIVGVPAEERPVYSPGYYWWAGFPGCLPDGDPVGPFPTEEAAIQDAREC